MAVPIVVAQVPASTPIVQRQQDASQLIQQGKALYDAGKFEEAGRVLQQAADAFAAQGDKLNGAIALGNLSLTYQQLGNWQQAKQAITNSLNLLKNQKNTPERSRILASALDIQGQLQLGLGQAQEALDTWHQMANTYAQIGDRSGVTQSQINQAQAMQALGLYPRACKTLLQALGIDTQECQLSNDALQTLQKQPDSLSKLDGLRSLGNVLRVMGNNKQSQVVLAESLQLAQKLGDTQDIAAVDLSLGNTALAQGKRSSQQEKARQQTLTLSQSGECRPAKSNGSTVEFYQQAANCYRQAELLGSPTTSIQAQINLLNLLVQTQLWSEVPVVLHKIQSHLDRLPASRTAVFARINLAQSLMCLQSALSQKPSELSSPILEQCEPTQIAKSNTLQPSQIPSREDIGQILGTALNQARSLEDKRTEAYALGYLGGLYQQMGQLPKAQELTKQALQVISAFDAPDIAYRWQWQLGRLEQIQGNQQGAVAAYLTAFQSLQSLRGDLVAINPEIQFTFRDSVEPVYREFVDLLLKEKNSSQDHLKQARETIEALQLAELDNFFRDACADAKPEQIDRVVDQASPKAAVFYAILLKDRLEVIAKFPGQEALEPYTTNIPRQKAQEVLTQLQQYLSDITRTFEVRELSQQVYSWLIQPAETKLAASQIKTLVFVLDNPLRNIPMAVLYDGQKYLVQKYAIALTPGLQLLAPRPVVQVSLNALTGGVSEKINLEGQEFNRLENVKLELQEVRSVVPDTEQLLNQDFTEIKLKNRIDRTKFTVVHMATHGQFSSNPEETFIVLSDKLLRVSGLENLLRTSDPIDSTPIELLVLSACETAAGDNRAVLGLAGVAVKTGARSTLATLWQVDDQLTASFMKTFYQELEKPNITKAEALQSAQLSVLDKEKRPYFWAPYTLVGNWL
ncbi:CHAT domain-containing protein [Fischerella sp. PCC 9605]|uniref:CHAT domain-containing protein n=1 Tax=Fischerella sp. PCC 9605 TaxID=1173024 RepID=UPI0004B96123|nr:CHAT domain-containing protein [Fischerella sp. PCC 9605]